MYEQLSLFSSKPTSNNSGGSDSSETNINDKMKCFQSELKDVKYFSIDELFSGYNTIKAITFSYDIGFIDSIMQFFEYGEILLGADFLVRKDERLQEVLVNAYEACQAIQSKERLIKLLQDGDVEFRTPLFILDHRKIYLLHSDTGKSRVIVSSANMSNNAWNGNHMEIYTFDDSNYAYEQYSQDFETAWLNAQEIPYSVISSKKSDDEVEGNAILKTIKETNKALVLQHPQNPDIETIKYTIDHDKFREDYKVLLSGTSIKEKNGLIEIIPKTIAKIEHNNKKILQKKAKTVEKTKAYPSLQFDYLKETALIDGTPLDLHPDEQEIRNDIDQILNLFQNFDEFVGNTQRLKENHFKMINALFASPFNAKLRCTAYLQGIGTSSLPMFLLAASSMANCGKTFTIRATLKMMTGADLPVMNKENCKKDDVRLCQIGCKGVPIFIDELDNKYKATIMDILKNPEKCEENQLDEQPVIVFASNDVVEPDEILRKRIVFIRFNGALPSTIDQSAYKGIGNSIIKRLGTAFYREYLRVMLSNVKKELDYMIYSNDIPDTYYPDLMKMSSSVILSILEKYGYDVPEYMKILTWNDDYSVNANYISDNSIEEIERLYFQDRKAFTLTKDTVIIEYGNDKTSQQKLKSWKNTLPPEMKAEFTSGKDCSRITLNRSELEKRLGYKLRKFSFFSGR